MKKRIPDTNIEQVKPSCDYICNQQWHYRHPNKQQIVKLRWFSNSNFLTKSLSFYDHYVYGIWHVWYVTYDLSSRFHNFDNICDNNNTSCNTADKIRAFIVCWAFCYTFTRPFQNYISSSIITSRLRLNIQTNNAEQDKLEFMPSVEFQQFSVFSSNENKVCISKIYIFFNLKQKYSLLQF